jgi:hypothetical protein
MKRLLLASALLAAIAAGPAQASGPTPGANVGIQVGTQVGTEPDQIAAALQKDGFRMVEFERGNGHIEVKAERDGRRLELKIDPTSGDITGIQDDD